MVDEVDDAVLKPTGIKTVHHVKHPGNGNACGVSEQDFLQPGMCRHKVTGHDWMLPELQRRYRGNFSPYLAKRISELASIGSERRAFAY